jgi:hypothetical protein
MGGSTPALAAILSITLLIGVSLEYSYFRKYPIVDRVRNVSLTATVFFRGPDGGVPQAEIGSVRDHSGSSAQFRARPAEIAERQALNPGTVPLIAARFSKSPPH